MKDHLTPDERRRRLEAGMARLVRMQSDPRSHRYHPHRCLTGACAICGEGERAHRPGWMARVIAWMLGETP